MKVAKVSLPLTAILVLGASGSAVAGPQSMLDPYSNIKPPTIKNPKDNPALKKLKTPVVRSAPAVVSAPISSKPEKELRSESGGGFVAGTKEIFHGIGTATKGAAAGVVTPVKALGAGVASGSKKVGHGVADGAKNSGGFFAKGAKAFGHGVKTAGGKMKDGTEAVGHKVAVVPKKMGEGLKATGEK